MLDTPSTRGWLLAFVMSGWLSNALVVRFSHDVELQHKLEHPWGLGLASVLALLVLGALVRVNSDARHRRLLWATAITLGTDVVVLAIAIRAQWLGGTAFQAPVLESILVYSPSVAFFVAVPLLVHRRLARVSELAATLTFVALVLSILSISAAAMYRLLGDRTFVFSHGYTVAWDTVWGLGQYGLAFGLYRCGALHGRDA